MKYQCQGCGDKGEILEGETLWDCARCDSRIAIHDGDNLRGELKALVEEWRERADRASINGATMASLKYDQCVDELEAVIEDE